MWLACAIPFLFPKRQLKHCSSSWQDTTRLLVREYAESAYLAWRRATPDQRCPSSLADLNPYTNKHGADIADPWGTDLAYQCPAPVGAGAGITVTSAGPDGRFDTDDDVASDD
jgi:hypothetical protein